MKRIGDWIQVASGGRFYPLDPRPGPRRGKGNRKGKTLIVGRAAEASV